MCGPIDFGHGVAHEDHSSDAVTVECGEQANGEASEKREG